MTRIKLSLALLMSGLFIMSPISYSKEDLLAQSKCLKHIEENQFKSGVIYLETRKICIKEAEEGNYLAQVHLADVYLSNYNLNFKNLTKEGQQHILNLRKWLEKAASHPNPHAAYPVENYMYSLALMYEHGEYKYGDPRWIKKDITQSLWWYGSAASLGHPKAIKRFEWYRKP